MPSPSTSSSSLFSLTSDNLQDINEQLSDATPQEILTWSIENIPNLFQTTAFGLTGVAALHMMKELREQKGMKQPPVIFIDSLYHFPETLALRDAIEFTYDVDVSTYTPQSASTAKQFEDLYGKELWKNDAEAYDYLVKVEPARRAYEELDVRAVITGRRRSQGAARASLKPFEIDETGLIKVNPLCNWTFAEVKSYIDSHNVLYNPLLDKGYKSIGDWHSTSRPGAVKPNNDAADADERSGRWSGEEKTECGLHRDYFKMRRAFEKKRREAELMVRDQANHPED
ncbi:Phosphoadenosine phosphosulfate reductase thioredoxin, partial [Atractiella rhizophila]